MQLSAAPVLNLLLPRPIAGRILIEEDADADAVHLRPVLVMHLVLPNQGPTVGGAAHPSSANGARGMTHHTYIEGEGEAADANLVLSSHRMMLPAPLRNNQPTVRNRAAALRRLSSINGPSKHQRRRQSSLLSMRLSLLLRT